jgi:hypothetical protein
MYRAALPLLFAALLLSSCYYGVMQGARTLGKGHINLTGGVTIPAYFSTADKREAESTQDDFLDVYPSFSFAIGATDRVDLAVTAFGYGVGPSVKYSFLAPEAANAVSALLEMNFVVTAQVMMPRLSLCAGRLFGQDLEAFAGADVGYGPDLANIPETEGGSFDWDHVENTLFACVRAGCRYEVRPPGSPNADDKWLPEAVMFQFSIPLDLSRGMILAGIGVSY